MNLVLTNPSEPPETLKAIITAINGDEALLASQGAAITELQGSVPGTAPANEVVAGPASGSAAAPAPRALVSADLPAVITPKTIYSAAGTPLPTASDALKGARAVVSDATIPTFLGAYVSGGAVMAPVLCIGLSGGWVTA